MSAPTLPRDWSPDEVRALGVKTNLTTAYSIVLGGGKNRAWQAYHEGELPFPTIRVGRRVVVPVSAILALLGLTDAP